MAKWSGKIGYAMPEVEVRPGVWKSDAIVERQAYGDLTRDFRRNVVSSETTNDNVTISNQLSIIADSFAMENFYCIKYVKWMGAAWKVESIDASQRPRLILSLGGVYNGEQA